MAYNLFVQKNNPYTKGLLTLGRLQNIQKLFCRLIGIKNSTATILHRIDEEVEELHQAVTGHNKKEVAGELADVVIFVATLANHYHISLHTSVVSKLKRNFVKYNPTAMKILRRNGLSENQAMSFLKKKWNKIHVGR